MSEDKLSQSINISGEKISNIQIGIARRDQTVYQTQHIGKNRSEVPINQSDVVSSISQLEDLFHSSNLPDEHANRALKYLETAKEEAQSEEPDKEFTAKSLNRATTVLKEAGKTVEASTSLWKQVKPLLENISPWLGAATKFLF